MYYGWYSEACDRRNGHAVYLDKDGNEVKITEVMSDSDKKPTNKWNDNIYVGEVVKWVRTIDYLDGLSTMALLEKVQEMVKEQQVCQAQSPVSKRCFCGTCPINNSN